MLRGHKQLFRRVDDNPNSLVAKMARLVAATEHARNEPSRQARPDRGKELEAVVRLGDSFPLRSRQELTYPVLKRLLKSVQPADRTGRPPSTG